MEDLKIYIPTFISSVDYQPVKTLPHVYFYNGVKDCQTYFIEGRIGSFDLIFANSQSVFPYVDNYQGNPSNATSRSLLFFNETPVYGVAPTASLYSEYWSDYVELLYNPRTRLIDCSAIIPLADYFKMELNDIVEWRGNYYHLRAINDYNLSNGACNLQLLGPVLRDTIENLLPPSIQCQFNFTVETLPVTTSLWDVTSCDGNTTLYGVNFNTTASLTASNSIIWGSPSIYEGCWSITPSTASPDITGAIVYQQYEDCADCISQSLWDLTACIGEENYTGVRFETTSSLTSSQVIRWGQGENIVSGCFTLSTSISPLTYSSSIVYQIFEDCMTCTGSTPPEPPTSSFTYNYYDVDKYSCFPCALEEENLIARSTSSFNLVTGNYYNNGDGFVYLVNGSTGSTAYTVDYLSASAGTNCFMTCMI